MPPSIQFYADLQQILKNRRIPSETIVMIYRSIDPYIRQFTANNKDTYQLITKLVNDYEAGNVDTSQNAAAIASHSLKKEIFQLQNKLTQQRKVIDNQTMEIERLTQQISEMHCLVKEKNHEINELNSIVFNLEHSYDELKLDLDMLYKTFQEKEKYFQKKMHELNDKNPPIALPTMMHSTKYDDSVRELYYTLLSMRVPLRQVESIVRVVISHLMPHVNIDDVRLPKKSCAAYMRSDEMAFISRAHKAKRLIESEKWHLKSDGTALHQKKKVTFLLNDVVLGVVDIPDGTSKAATQALKLELDKLRNVPETLSYNDAENRLSMAHIVSSTADGASTQTKFNKFLEIECGRSS